MPSPSVLDIILAAIAKANPQAGPNAPAAPFDFLGMNARRPPPGGRPNPLGVLAAMNPGAAEAAMSPGRSLSGPMPWDEAAPEVGGMSPMPGAAMSMPEGPMSMAPDAAMGQMAQGAPPPPAAPVRRPAPRPAPPPPAAMAPARDAMAPGMGGMRMRPGATQGPVGGMPAGMEQIMAAIKGAQTAGAAPLSNAQVWGGPVPRTPLRSAPIKKDILGSDTYGMAPGLPKDEAAIPVGTKPKRAPFGPGAAYALMPGTVKASGGIGMPTMPTAYNDIDFSRPYSRQFKY